MQNERFSVRSSSLRKDSLTIRRKSTSNKGYSTAATDVPVDTTATTELQLLVDRSNQLEQSKLYRKFYWFSFIMSLNHSVNYVVIAYSTTLLG